MTTSTETTADTDGTAATPGNGASIDVRGIVKRYPEVVALDDVTLRVRAGEFITLLGSSGSGKSTLLSIIAGFVAPTAGSIEVDGRAITTLPPYKRDLGMVFQHYALFPHMTVWENVAFPLRRRRVRGRELATRVQGALEVVELAGLGRRRTSQLSGGQQQRVALARAIVFRPRVLLMDEPLGALDKRLREQLQLEIKRLHRELGITFVFVTHDQQEALAMSDRIALLRDGAIVQVGTPEELYARPSCRYAADFLGESNTLRGTCEGGVFVDTTSGARMPATAGPDGLAAMVVRPEHVGLALDSAPVPAGRIALSGVVRETIYLGSGVRVEVTLPDGRHLLARAAATGHHGLRPGRPVVLHWRPEDCVFVPDEPDVTREPQAR